MESFIQKVLVPIDFSDSSKNALKYAVEFGKVFNAKLFLIYVVEPVVYPADFSMGQIALPAVDTEINARAKEELDNLAQKEISENLAYETIIKMGKPFVEINDTAAELDVDLVIIASHGHTGVEQILFGSTAEKVVRKAPCPVLTVREPLKGYKYNP